MQENNTPIYWALDRRTNTKGFISDLSDSHLKNLVDDGFELIKEVDGISTTVKPDEVIRPIPIQPMTARIVSPEYVNERFELLLQIMEKSFAPALSLLPTSTRKDISDSYTAFKKLINGGTHADR